MNKKTNQLPDITVVICTYNHGEWIERCIRSLLNQQFINKNNYEIILIDDKSTDSTKKIIKSFKDLQNLRIYRNPKNIGLPKSLNKAIKLSKGRYVTRVDSDDYVQRNFLNDFSEALYCSFCIKFIKTILPFSLGIVKNFL